MRITIFYILFLMGILFEAQSNSTVPLQNITVLPNPLPTVKSFRVEKSDDAVTYEDVPLIKQYSKTQIRLFGENLTADTYIIFTDAPSKKNTICNLPKTEYYILKQVTLDGFTGIAVTRLPYLSKKTRFFLCVTRGDPATSNTVFLHQGTEHWLSLGTYTTILPIWLIVMCVMTCLVLSAIFSGLNLGMMSLDRTELEILCNAGTDVEKAQAQKVKPIRNKGNYLLCAILISNVFVNNITTTLLNEILASLLTVLLSTTLIVLLGEVIPQAICFRQGLAISAKTIWVTRVILVITAPVSWPLGKLLDKWLGEDVGMVYNRESLKEMFKVNTVRTDLIDDEMKIISGALELRKKKVVDIMTQIYDVYMIDIEAVLDFETISDIMQSGYSRIPIYENNKNNIVAILYARDLAFVDPDSKTPIRTHCSYFQREWLFVDENDTLDCVLKEFKDGEKGHLAIVRRKLEDFFDKTISYQTLGVVTLEDVIEEIIQTEIVDETDVIYDNRTRRKRFAHRKAIDFKELPLRRDQPEVSSHLVWMAFQFLTTSVDIFKPDHITPANLKQLVGRENFFFARRKKKTPHEIYTRYKPADYFVVILEGQVEVLLDEERFEAGPFTTFGIQALQDNGAKRVNYFKTDADNLPKMFRPEYTVRPLTDVTYLKINRFDYMNARKPVKGDRGPADERTSADGLDNTPPTEDDESIYTDDYRTPPPSLHSKK